jgi:hypothetical protein
MFLAWKYIKIKFFYFLKIIFDISTSKLSENIKKNHENFKKFWKHGLHRVSKYTLNQI